MAGHKSGLRSVAFSARRDSLHLLSCDVGGLIAQWDVGTGKRDFDLLHRHEGDIVPGSTNAPEIHTFGTVAAYGPDGRTIVSVGMDQWVMIWDATTHQVLEQVRTAGIPNGSLSIAANGRELVLGTTSAAVEILDLGRLHEQSRGFSTGSGMPRVALSPDGKTLAICRATGAVQLLDPQSGQVQDMFEDQVNTSNYPMAFGPDGRRLAMAVGAEIHVVRVFRSLHGTSVASIPGPIRRLAASRDQELLALGRDDGTIAIWDLRKGQVVQILRGHELGVQALAFVNRPDGAWLVSAGGDGLVQIWDPRAGGQPLRTLSGHLGAVLAVAVRADGRQIATGGGDGYVRTWDPVSGRLDLALIEHGGSITALAYDPTGAVLASGGMDRTVRVWSATSGRRRLGPLSHPHQLTSLGFSPDGRLLAGGGVKADGGGALLIWNAWSGTLSTTVVCPRGVDCLSFSSDSRRIATCGLDKAVHVWDATGGQETLELTGDDRVSAVLFAPHALRLYSAGSDGVVKLWDGSTSAPAE